MNVTPVSSKNVQMISFENGTKEEIKVHREEDNAGDLRINFWDAFRCRGLALISLVLVVAVFQWIVVLSYTSTIVGLFSKIQRELIWVFLVIAILFTLLLGWIAMVWKRVALNALKFAGSRDQSTKNKEINALEKKQTFVERLRNNFGINGKYYLWRLYLYELIENWIQYYNLRQVFL